MQFKTQRIVIPDYVMAREVGGEIVILNLDNEQYYGLDEVGARMWTVLGESSSIQVALETLHDEYDVDMETLSSDLEALINKLSEQGLLELHDA